MRFLLRSTILATPADDPDLAFRNFLALSDSGLGFDVSEDNTLWDFIRDFSRTHNHCPDVRTVRSHFETLKKHEPVDRLEVISTLRPLYKGDFVKRLEEMAEERRTRRVIELLKEAGTITQTGMEIQEGREKRLIRGPIDAVRYLMAKSHDIVMPTTGLRLSGEVTLDGDDFKSDYDRVKNDPLAGMGQFTGIEQMDAALRGAKRFELWTHAAFTGGLKSTFALNWAYNQAVYMKYDVCFFSLEMPYHQCRRILYAMHSLHGKFKDIRIQLGIQRNPGPTVGLEYGKIHIEVADPDKTDFTLLDVKSKAELIYSKSPFHTLFIDHAGLMAARTKSTNTTDRLNEVLRDCKRLAMNFNRGQGMAVVVLFQISREGFKSAEKSAEKSQGTYNTGPYNLTHLSYANEAERSSDIVTASYVDDNLRSQNRVLFQCLKSRDQAPFQNFFARVEWSCRRILTSHEVPMLKPSQGGKDGSNAFKDTLDEIAGLV